MSNDKTSAKGPYTVEWSGENRTARVHGLSFIGPWKKEGAAVHQCADMNTAYLAGQASQSSAPVDMTNEEYHGMLAQLKEGKPVAVPVSAAHVGPTIDQIMEVVERWRWKPGTTSLTAMEDLRKRLSSLFK